MTGATTNCTINRPMRILMLTESYAPIVGGVERIVEDLSIELARRDHEVAIATLRQPPGEPPNGSGGVRIHTLRSSTSRLGGLLRDTERRHSPPVPDPETVIDLRRVLREVRPEIVHAHNWIVHSYLPLDRDGEAGLVLSMHDYGLLCPTKRLLYRSAPCIGPGPWKCVRCAGHHYGPGKGLAVALGARTRESTVRRHVEVFLPVSETVRERGRLGSADTYRIVPNFIRELPPLQRKDDPRLAELPDEPFILFFGDVTEDKGGWHLARVYETLERPPPLVMIGRGYLGELGDRPGVSVLGPWPHELVIEALRRCLFTVAPSIWPEPFGLVALEAAAAGKATIASGIGGLRDIVIDGETGLLVPPGDRGELQAALQRLIGDEDLRARMGEAAGRRALQFSPEAVVPQFEEAYMIAAEARRLKRQSNR